MAVLVVGLGVVTVAVVGRNIMASPVFVRPVTVHVAPCTPGQSQGDSQATDDASAS